MDKLGLESPKTIEDAEAIVKAFIEKDPGGNGEGKTVGFVCDPELSGECGYSSEYLMDIVFAANDAYPKQWIEDEMEMSLTDQFCRRQKMHLLSLEACMSAIY